MGLFDYQDPESVGKLMFAAGLLNSAGSQRMPVSTGQAIAQGLLGQQQGATEAAMNQRRNALVDAQLQEHQARLAQAAQSQKQQQQLSEYLGTLGPRSQPGATIMRPETMQQMPAQTPDPLTLIRMGMSPEQAQKLAGVQDWGKPTVARTTEVRGPNGEKLVQQLDSFGRPVGQPMRGYIPPHLVNQGDKQTFVEPTAGFSLPVNMSPEQRDSSARGWAGVNETRRHNLSAEGLDAGGQKEAVVKFGKPPAGYRWKEDGSLEQIPGGPADQKTQATQIGKGTVSDVIVSLRSMYDDLDRSGGITNPERGIASNAIAASRSSDAGQATGRLFGTQDQSLRNTIAQQRPLLLQAIMKATGMSAKQMDSNAELKLYLSTATDPQLDVSANRRALDMLENLYGVRADGSSPPKATTQTKPGVNRIASDSDYASLPSGAVFIAPDGSTRRKL